MAEIDIEVIYTRTQSFTTVVTVDIPDDLLVADEDKRYDNIHEWLTDNVEKWADDTQATEDSDEVEVEEFAEAE